MKPLQQVEHTIHDLVSPKRGHTFLGMLGTLLVCGFLLWLQHGDWLKHPNDIMLGGAPDGFKNYFTSAWHVRHDKSYVHYGGMNYPFGEHVLFTDNQPVISAGMQWWSRHVSDLSDQSIGVINVLQVLSLLLGCGALFLLVRKLHLPVWYAGIASIGLTFLAPQYQRFDGHFGLSHTFVIPMLLLFLCRYEERLSRRYQSLHIGILVWFTAQIHFYYFGMAALFLSLYIVFQILRKLTWSNFVRRISHWLTMLIIPFVFLNIWIHWTNYATDRPANPYGFTVYIGFWEGVFLPYEQFPLFQWIDTKLVHIRRIDFEAHAYAGALALFATLWILLGARITRFIRDIYNKTGWKVAFKNSIPQFRIFPKTWEDMAYHRVHKQYLRGIFFAAFFLLLFACGFPFAIKGLEWVANYFGPIRQFRGLGRFTWVYYYVINLIIFYAAWNWSRRFTGIFGGRFIPLKWVIAGIPLVVVLLEANTMQKTKKIELQDNTARREVFAKEPDHWLNKVDFSPYQAFLPLPYYHMGSENVWLDFDYGLYRRVQATAFQTGIPDMGVNMSRTPVGETVQSVQLTLEPMDMPEILNRLPNNKPLALLVNANSWDDVQRKYRHLISKAKMVYEHKDIKIMSLELDSIRSFVRQRVAEVDHGLDTMTWHSIAGSPWKSLRSEKDFIYLSYDSLTTTAHRFQGKGAYQGSMGDTTQLWNAPLPKGRYVVSFWIKANEDMGMNHELKIIENSRSDGHEIHFKHEGLRFYMKGICKEWALFEEYFEVYEGENVRVLLHKKDANAPFFLDEVLIRPVNTEVMRKDPDWIVRNNYWYHKN